MANQIEQAQKGTILIYNKDASASMSTKPTQAAIGSNFKAWVCPFQDAALPVETWILQAPNNFDASKPITIKIYWSSTATSGNVMFGHYILPLALNEAYDGAITYTDWDVAATPGTANTLQITSKEILAATHNIQPGELLLLAIRRNGTHASDTLATAANVFAIVIEYYIGV